MSGQWCEQEIGNAQLQLIDGDRGKAYPKHADFSDMGHCLFLSATNVTSSGFEFADCQFISEQKDHELRKGKLARNDVVLTTRGTIGNTAMYGENVPYEHVRINSGMVIMRADPDRLLSRFLYGFLRSPSFFGQVDQLRSGVAQPQLPIRDIKKIKLHVPPLPIQERVVAVFSAYDDLIENNRRRMALLEEAARQLYREWFVRLRFPGHEHTRITDGVPEGWEKRPLGDLATLNYGKALKEADRIPGDVAVYGSSGVVGSHENKLVESPSIVVGRKGNVGSVYWVDQTSWPIDTVYYIGPEQSSLHLFHSLQWLPFQSSDAAVPGLNRNYAYSLPVLVPSETLLTQFDEFARQNHSLIRNLKLANQKIMAARDLLLPRLMSGELVV